MRKNFLAHTRWVGSLIRRSKRLSGANAREAAVKKLSEHPSIALLTPLIEIAWADNRISRRELELISRVADTYPMAKDDWEYRELLERLMSKPSKEKALRMWYELEVFLDGLSASERRIACSSLRAQAEFLADYGADGEPDKELIESIARKLTSKIESIGGANRNEDKELRPFEFQKGGTKNTMNPNSSKEESTDTDTLDDMEKLIPLVPLVKVAWAEGRITKRERELIFKAAENAGVAFGSSTHDRLSSWLELHPTDDFYADSLERLNETWDTLPADEKNLRALDLLSDCINIAEASGGSRYYPGGGRRVCDEEIAAVKRIAEKLRTSAVLSPAICY